MSKNYKKRYAKIANSKWFKNHYCNVGVEYIYTDNEEN